MAGPSRRNTGPGARKGDAGEKGDARRTSGGPGDPDHRYSSSRSRGDQSGTPRTTIISTAVKTDRAASAKGNRETHAGKHQPEESGPGRASKPPPRRGRVQPH